MIPRIVNPSAVGNPDETPIVVIAPEEFYGASIPLLDDLHEFLDRIYDLLPAYEQNRLRYFQERIELFMTGDTDELGTAY